MPRLSRFGRGQICHEPATIKPVPFLSFLLPAFDSLPQFMRRNDSSPRAFHTRSQRTIQKDVERLFMSALAHAASGCSKRSQNTVPSGSISLYRTDFSTDRKPTLKSSAVTRARGLTRNLDYNFRWIAEPPVLQEGQEVTSLEGKSDSHSVDPSKDEAQLPVPRGSHLDHGPTDSRYDAEDQRHRNRWHRDTALESEEALGAHVDPCLPISCGRSRRPRGSQRFEYSIDRGEVGDSRLDPEDSGISLTDKLRLLKTVRDLEKKLSRAQHVLQEAMQKKATPIPNELALHNQGGAWPRASMIATDGTDILTQPGPPQVTLTKEDYLSLVDLYFYTHHVRFSPDYPDMSPNPLFLESYSFKLSENFSQPPIDRPDLDWDDPEEPETSPLRHVEDMLKSRQLREISTMQVFVDLLLNERTSNRALFEAYKVLPEPGVSYLPAGVIRLFLQRMSTPWTKSQNASLRYLALIDDMQKASLPISVSEWSSAIYLAGRSFSRVVKSDVAAAFRIWTQMENEAGVRATHVTFNILFDIAVRAGKFVLAETILQEMYERGLRLNRLGRVSLMYYHGCRGDGDGIRKSYRDFVEAGEVVDTLVLNCVMASLIKAQEPTAAEQVYERMKSLQDRLRRGAREEGEELLFVKYPSPGPTKLGKEIASNSLGRILLRAPKLRDILPEHHTHLQNSMPLTPDYTTYRNLIAHHATTSGDLDRLTVLMNDMTQQSGLPISTLLFQLLFKGFAIHGGSKRSDARWTVQRLELVWQACLSAIRESNRRRPSALKEDNFVNVPSMEEVEAHAAKEEESGEDSTTVPVPKPKLTAWGTFLRDFTTPGGKHSRGSEIYSSPLFPTDSDVDSEYLNEKDADTEYSPPQRKPASTLHYPPHETQQTFEQRRAW